MTTFAISFRLPENGQLLNVLLQMDRSGQSGSKQLTEATTDGDESNSGQDPANGYVGNSAQIVIQKLQDPELRDHELSNASEENKRPGGGWIL